jgi:putative ATPase
MDKYSPLANRLRPQKLSQFIGQKHLVDKGMPIKLMIESKKPYSIIFWGPPGCGKTTLARLIATAVSAQFFQLSAVSAGKNDIKSIIEKTKITKLEHNLFSSEKQKKSKMHPHNVLLLDEIHRFNKAQQDFLLPYVEDGSLTLIGATTENPSFEVISALLSRCRVFVLKQLTQLELEKIIDRACKFTNLKIETKAKQFLAEFSNGDGRIAINAIEIASQTLKNGNKISLQFIKEVLQKKALFYDKGADQHHDTISAFIKSMRASNIDAALYYLARMVEAGEDPKFIARRMVVFASEDIGLAQPTALVVANDVFRAVENVGYPEAQINLAHGVAYLCQCKKDRSAYNAYFSALEDVKKYGNLPIPMNLRNAPTRLMKELGYGDGYEKYGKKSLLPDKIKNRKYY